MIRAGYRSKRLQYTLQPSNIISIFVVELYKISFKRILLFLSESEFDHF